MILIISAIVHLLFFGNPASVVFDEVHIGHYIVEYLKGNYMFDVHPPLGRLIFLSFAVLLGADPNVDFDQIGNTLPEWAVLLRIVPIVAGIFLPIIVYGILRYLNISKSISLVTGLMICFESSLIVHSRFLLVDSIMLFFGFLSILLYLQYYKKNNRYALLASILFASMAFSIKWTGLAFIFMIIASEIYRKGIMKSIKFVLASLFILFIFYAFIFSLHFSLLPNSGTGDDFMTPRFQSTLIGNKYHLDQNIKPIGFWSKFFEVNTEMLLANTRLTEVHPYSSKWYTWPFMQRTVYYWNYDYIEDDKGAYIYLIGNPLVYWGGLFSIILLLIMSIKKSILKDKVTLFVILGYLINFLPFIFIGRVMFLYHYEAALIFSCMAVAVVLSKIKSVNIANILAIIFLIGSFILFLYFSPIVYGTPITKEQLDSRMWLATWR
jgi:dolichyl-phosphate-mannose-protein mannosyltransferase